MKVWRLEHKRDGKGPWTTALRNAHPKLSDWEWFNRNVPGSDRFRGPSGDGLGRRMESTEVCGCERRGKLNEWFNVAALAAIGFEVVQYEVPTAEVGKARNQVVFDPSAATERKVVT